jgi:hypothetical protein
MSTSLDGNLDQNATLPPPRSPVAAPSPRQRPSHAKGLSLNFPILLPTNPVSVTASPRDASPTATSARASPHTKSVSFHDSASAAPSPVLGNGTDFLTLVAAQERRVLELREELVKAESQLTNLKKEWAVHEANRKRDELRQLRKMPVALDSIAPSPQGADEDDVEEERRRRRALVEMNNNAAGLSSQRTAPGRRGSQRKIFEGKHTRALSLLSPTSPRRSNELSSIASEISEDDSLRNSEEMHTRSDPSVLERKQSLSKMPTLDGLISPDALQMGHTFGKTYKDLAAQHRRSLPPAAMDMVKQGRFVVEGVRDGLWTFFEDLKQATVGEEAIHGASLQQQQRMNGHTGRPTRTKSKSKTPSELPQTKKDDSFWKEFGLDTPNKENRNGHVQQRSESSTDSQSPPDLLDDIKDEEEWESWESPSPVMSRQTVKVESPKGDDLAWPELKKTTPSKLNRTGSDLIHEWDKDNEQHDSIGV